MELPLSGPTLRCRPTGLPLRVLPVRPRLDTLAPPLRKHLRRSATLRGGTRALAPRTDLLLRSHTLLRSTLVRLHLFTPCAIRNSAGPTGPPPSVGGEKISMKKKLGSLLLAPLLRGNDSTSEARRFRDASLEILLAARTHDRPEGDFARLALRTSIGVRLLAGELERRVLPLRGLDFGSPTCLDLLLRRWLATWFALGRTLRSSAPARRSLRTCRSHLLLEELVELTRSHVSARDSAPRGHTGHFLSSFRFIGYRTTLTWLQHRAGQRVSLRVRATAVHHGRDSGDA